MIQVQDIIAELSRHSPTTLVEGYNGIEGIVGRRTITMLTEAPLGIQESFEAGVKEGASEGIDEGFDKCKKLTESMIGEFACKECCDTLKDRLDNILIL